MSAEAAAKLRELWGQLQFFTVDRTVAREPEDVLYIDIQKPIGSYPSGEPMFNGSEPRNEYKRLSQVPKKDRWRARVSWRYFYGFTTEGIRFDSDSYNELNWHFGHGGGLLEFGTDYGATHISDRPAPGQIICGIVEDTPKGQRLTKWFVCDEAFRLLVTSVREGTEHTEEELGRLLLTDGYPDIYWALARLVLFDNVQAFVDCIKIGSASVTVGQLFMGHPATKSSTSSGFGVHPAYGKPHGRHQLRVDWNGMFIGAGFAQFVHELSYTLNEPRWWEQFLQLASSQGVLHSHPSLGGVCNACMAGNPNWFNDYCEGGGGTNWPYQMGPHSS